MLENSYDVPGIKFGILLSPDLHTHGRTLKNSNNARFVYEIMDEIITSPSHAIIDFSNVDGLTIGEVSEMSKSNQASNCIVFVVYSNMKEGEKVVYNCVYTYLFIDVNQELSNIPIDKVIENHYMTNYSEQDEETKKRINCFLQRYRYKTKERTDEIIKEKVYKK